MFRKVRDKAERELNRSQTRELWGRGQGKEKKRKQQPPPQGTQAIENLSYLVMHLWAIQRLSQFQ